MKTISYTVITMYFILLLYPISQAIGGSVKCECPTIKAKGTGNSDCSTSESGDVCTIDFNTFDEEDENKALKLVSEILGDDKIKINYTRMGYGTNDHDGLDPSAANRLLEKGPLHLIDQLVVYTMVSVVQNDSAKIDKSRLKGVLETLRKNAPEASDAFIGKIRDFRWQKILVTPGCIEIGDGNDLWAMYKSRLSPAAKSPRCQK